MAEKKTWSQDIHLEAIAKFEEIAESLPGHKWQVLEAMIYTFGALDPFIQREALAGNYNVERQLRILEHIRAADAHHKAAAEGESNPQPDQPTGQRKRR